MGFKVIYKGLEVIVDSIDDLDRLAERTSKASTNGHSTQTKQSELGDIPKFVKSLTGKPKLALQALVKHGGKISADDLCKAVDVADNLKLAGHALSPLSRMAKKAGVDIAEIIEKVPVIDKETQKRTLEYVMPRNAFAQVREGLGM